MSGETEREVSGWTVDTLHIHIDTQFADLRRNLDERFQAQQEMVKTALASSDKRFESVNEFRSQQKDIIAGFVTRAEYLAAHKSLSDKVDGLSTRVDNSSGSSTQTYRLIGIGFAALTIVLTVVVFVANFLTRT